MCNTLSTNLNAYVAFHQVQNNVVSSIPPRKLRFFPQLSHLFSKPRLSTTDPLLHPETQIPSNDSSDHFPEKITSKSNLLEKISSPTHLDERPSCLKGASDAQSPEPIDPLPQAETQLLGNDSNNHFLEKITSKPNFLKKISLEAQSPELIVGTSVLSKDLVLDTLLIHKTDPKSTLKFFKGVERKQGFVKTVDILCLLLHILASSPNTHRVVRNLLNNYVSRDSGHAARVFVEQLVKSAGGLYDETVQRKIYDDYFTLHVLMRACLKERRIEEAESYFEEVKGKGLNFDVVVYNILIQAICKWSNSNLAGELKEDEKIGLGVI